MFKSEKFHHDLDAFRTGRYEPVVFDVETTIVDGSPSPWDGASVVLWGFQFQDEAELLKHENVISDHLKDMEEWAQPLPIVYVGHNIKFDVQHAEHVGFKLLTDDVCGVWDTQIAHYLITGQEGKMASLETVAEYNGIVDFTKDEEVAEAFKRGEGADTLDPERLADYLKADLMTTMQVYRKQREWIERTCPRLLAHVWVQSMASIAYGRMESNGIKLDTVSAQELADQLDADVTLITDMLHKWVRTKLPALTEEEATPTNRLLSACIFGIPGIKVKRKKVVGKYKNGKPKVKQVEEMVYPSMLKSLADPEKVYGPEYAQYNNPTLGYSLDDSWLERIEDCYEGEEYEKVASLLRVKRAKEKILSTYLKPLLDKTTSSKDGLIHGKFNTCVTHTGRTSSSSPNLQNQAPEVRKLIIPHLHDGLILQADFKQLEMWAAGELSSDSKMLHDLTHSDMHFETGKETLGWKRPEDVSKDERRKIKALNFGMIYGGGVPKLAAQSGVPATVVTRHRDVFFDRYTEFGEWQKEWHKCAATAPIVGSQELDGYSCSIRRRIAPSGRLLTFKEKPHKRPWDGRVEVKVSWSETCNYPVQSFATADVVPLFIVMYEFYTGEKLMGEQPLAAVHDSLVISIAGPFTAGVIRGNLTSLVDDHLKDVIYYVYGMEVKVAPTLEFEHGKTWF